jgi:hypothetical protein
VVRLWSWGGSKPPAPSTWVKAIDEPMPCPNGRAVAFSPNGSVLLAVGEQGVSFWDVGRRAPLGVPLRVGSADTRSCFSGDGKYVLTAAGKDVRLWRTPVPCANRHAAVTLWVELRTGQELGDDDNLQALDAAALKQRRQRLEQLLGL